MIHDVNTIYATCAEAPGVALKRLNLLEKMTSRLQDADFPLGASGALDPEMGWRRIAAARETRRQQCEVGKVGLMRYW
jgi:hypothetical protein